MCYRFASLLMASLNVFSYLISRLYFDQVYALISVLSLAIAGLSMDLIFKIHEKPFPFLFALLTNSCMLNL